MSRPLQNAIIHINGWPGSGKLTIARLLAARLEARLVDKHTLINPAEMLFTRRDPLYRSLRAEVRRAVFEHIVRADPKASFIFTDALSGDAFDSRSFSDFAELARQRNARLFAVVLDCTAEENERRLVSEERAERAKLTDPDVLRRLRAGHDLLRGKADHRVELDVTTLSATDAADRLATALLA